MRKILTHFTSVITVIMLITSMVLIPIINAAPLQQATCSLTGTVFRDFNADTTQGTNEPGVPGITVTAYDAAGTAVATATSDSNGDYSLTVPQGVEVRLEYTDLPDFLRYGPIGSSTAGVTFETCSPGMSPVNLAVANPGQYCDDNPTLMASCFVLGDQITGGNSGRTTLYTFPYNAGSDDLTTPGFGNLGRFSAPAPGTIALASEIGSVWGLTHQREQNVVYAAAFQKRHAGYGPGGPGAIYAIDSSGNTSIFTTLNAAPANDLIHTDGTTYADHPGIEPWVVDREAFAWVGKAGLGDMTLSDDGSTLYVVNLYDRNLYAIPVNDPGAATSVALPTSLPNCPAASDARPFAVEFHDGQVYVGLVCSAQSTQNPSDLYGYVYSASPGSGVFTNVLQFPLDYPRLCANEASYGNCQTNYPAEWNPWSIGMPTIHKDTAPYMAVYPQPWLSDIEFDNNGDMIIGLRDLFADQMGHNAYSPVMNDPDLYRGISSGDILRACSLAGGGWSLENNASCGGITTTGGATGSGPGGNEYYYDEYLQNYHDELSMGSVLQIAGQSDVVSTVFDPIPIHEQVYDGGFRWYDNTAGAMTRAYRLYANPGNDLTVFGKANGLGGLEAICPPAPIEIGNRVWHDVNNNGIQDPGEAPVANVTVNLYDSTNALVATTTTNARGEYLFTSAAHGLQFNTDYFIRLDNPADYINGGPLFGWNLTLDNVGSDTRANTIDSDGIMDNGFPTIAMTTGGPGENNHTYDFGFNDGSQPQQPTPSPVPTSTPVGTLPPGTPGTPPDGSTPLPGQPDLTITKSANPPFAQIGDHVTWIITVSNPTASALNNITVTDSIPDGMQIINATASRGNVNVNGNQVSLAISSLGPGEQITIQVETLLADIDNAPFIYVNTAYANDKSATAQVVRADQLVRTGETPWWRDPLLTVGAVLLISSVGVYITWRRKPNAI